MPLTQLEFKSSLILKVNLFKFCLKRSMAAIMLIMLMMILMMMYFKIKTP